MHEPMPHDPSFWYHCIDMYYMNEWIFRTTVVLDILELVLSTNMQTENNQNLFWEQIGLIDQAMLHK